MKRSLIFSTTLSLVLFLFFTAALAAATLYVTSEDAELKAESSSSSATIVALKRGTPLTQLAVDGRWYQVSVESGESVKTGWIYRGKVSEDKPEIEESAGDEGSLGGLLGGLSGSDINADAADSSRSIRGLSPEAKEYAKATGTPLQSQDALDSVIARKVTEKAIDQFLKNGKVGEYAE